MLRGTVIARDGKPTGARIGRFLSPD